MGSGRFEEVAVREISRNVDLLAGNALGRVGDIIDLALYYSKVLAAYRFFKVLFDRFHCETFTS